MVRHVQDYKKVTLPKLPILYNVIDDYTEFDEPGNVTVCAMTEKEDVAGHAKVLAESDGVPLDTMTLLLSQGRQLRLSRGRRISDEGSVCLPRRSDWCDSQLQRSCDDARACAERTRCSTGSGLLASSFRTVVFNYHVADRL